MDFYALNVNVDNIIYFAPQPPKKKHIYKKKNKIHGIGQKLLPMNEFI